MMFGEPIIPGQTPIDDLSGLRQRGIANQAELNAAEARNMRQAIQRYMRSRPGERLAPFDVPWALRLHHEMFGQVWTWAGAVRKRELNIGSPPRQIGVDLHNLFADLWAWHGHGMAMTEQAARLHHGAVRIHPFQNGNGRWSRLLANIWLRQRGAKPVLWPEALLGTSSVIRDQYLAAVRAADRGDFAPLLALHQEYDG